MYVVGYSIVLNTTRSLSLSEQFLLTYIRLHPTPINRLFDPSNQPTNAIGHSNGDVVAPCCFLTDKTERRPLDLSKLI